MNETRSRFRNLGKSDNKLWMNSIKFKSIKFQPFRYKDLPRHWLLDIVVTRHIPYYNPSYLHKNCISKEVKCIVYENITSSLKNHWTKHRHVCIHFDAFSMLIPNMDIKLTFLFVLDNIMKTCTWQLHTIFARGGSKRDPNKGSNLYKQGCVELKWNSFPLGELNV